MLENQTKLHIKCQGWFYKAVKSLIGGLWHWWVCELAISSVAACFSSPNIHRVDFAIFLPLRSQHSPFNLVFRLYSCPTPILTLIFACLSIRPHLPNVSIHDTTSLVQLARFPILFGGNFHKQQSVLGKLSNTVKWSTFSVSFICVLTTLG